MGKLVAGAVLLVIAFSLLLAAATLRSQRPGPVVNLVRLAGYVVAALALAVGAGSLLVVIDPILNSPAAVEQAIKEQSQGLAQDLAQNHVTVGTQQTEAWLRLLLENERAQKCLQDMKVAADKVLHMLQLLNPRLAG